MNDHKKIFTVNQRKTTKFLAFFYGYKTVRCIEKLKLKKKSHGPKLLQVDKKITFIYTHIHIVYKYA